MVRLLRLNARLWPLATLAVLVAVTALSLSPKPLRIDDPVAGNDKLQHLAAYLALALPVALARPRGWGWWIAGFALWSAAIEVVQPLVGRSTFFSDFLANAAGLALAVAAATGLRRAFGAEAAQARR